MGSRSGFNALEGREFEGFTHPKIGVGKGFVPDLSQICHREIGAPGGIRTPDQWLRKPLLYPAELRARTTRRRPPRTRILARLPRGVPLLG